jgi:hypothetical protein
VSYGYETIAEAATPEKALAGIKAANRDTVALCFVARLHQLIASVQGEQLLTYTREAQQAGDRGRTGDGQLGKVKRVTKPTAPLANGSPRPAGG